MLDKLTGALDFQAEALKLRSERTKVLAGNIANADTPGFKARDFDFGKSLASATHAMNSSSGSATSLSTTTAGHVATASAFGGAAGSARLQYRAVSQPSIDGNTVDSDVEQAKFAENTVRYESTLKFLNGQIRTILSAVNGQ
ncbi:flagellar basal body rod protein FlgB [soil metagenome]